jgi:hypothetical protein
MEEARKSEVVDIASRINAEVDALNTLVDVKEWWTEHMDAPLSDEILLAIRETEMLVYKRSHIGKAAVWSLKYTISDVLGMSYNCEGGF